MEKKQDHNAIEELNFIKQTIVDSKNIIINNGIGFILWGGILVIGLTLTFLNAYFRLGFNNGLLWFVILSLGWVYNLIVIRKEKKRDVSTFAGEITDAVWLSTGIAATIIVFIGLLGHAFHGVFICPLISIIFGIRYFVTGRLYGYRWITFLAAVWWIGAIIMFYIRGIEVLLIMSIMLIGLEVTPGIILYQKSKKSF